MPKPHLGISPLYIWEFLVIVALAFGISKLIRLFFDENGGKNRNRYVAKISFFGPVIVWIAAVIYLLSSFGVSMDSIAQILVAGGLVIGLVVTPAGSNIVAGFINASADVFRVDEVLELDDVVGSVIVRGIVSTRIETFDGTMYDIPNKLLLDKMVHNFSRIRYYRIVAEIHIDEPSFNLLKTEEVLWSVVKGKEKWNKYDAKLKQWVNS